MAAHKIAPIDPWLLTCLDPTVSAPALLWNGQIGVRIGRDGAGLGPMFSIDEYDTKDEEKIQRLDDILNGKWLVSGGGEDSVSLDPAGSSDYEQVLNMRTGLLTSSWTQKLGSCKIRVKVESVLQPLGGKLAQKWSIEADSYVDLSYKSEEKNDVLNVLDSDAHVIEWSRPQSDCKISEKDVQSADIRRRDPNADIMLPFSAGNGSIYVSAAADLSRPFTYARFIDFQDGSAPTEINKARETVASTETIHGPKWAFDDLNRATQPLFEDFVSEAQQVWAKRWETDIEVDGPVEDQQAIHSFLFYLRSAIDPNGSMSISPFGLSSDLYNGHVFWDADTWVFPALALIDPEEAKSIPTYRLELRKAARRNFDEWLAAGRPIYGSNLGLPQMGGEAWGYKFPWQSSVTGKETIRDPSRFEEHITGDVAFMLDQAAALGLAPAPDAKEVISGAANYYRLRSSGRNIDGVMSSDEMDIVDNDLYTNLVAQWCVNGGGWKQTSAPPFELPQDKTSFLTYSNDPLIHYKQAAALLSIYPLQYPPAEKEASVMLDRFAGKVLKDGPAMSDSLNALIWARLGESDKAYEAWERSWRNFVVEPHLLFQERPNKGKTYFTTGAAGCLQTVLYGFLGFRIDSQKQDGALWSTDLALGRILSVKPNLPKTWKSVKFKYFTVMGRRYTLIASRADSGKVGVQVTQGDR